MQSIRLRIASILLLALVATAMAPAIHAATWASEEEVRAILADRIDTAKQSVGIVVGLIDAEGRAVVGYGRSGPDDDSAPGGSTVFEIGSISKVFTGILLADLSKERKVSPQAKAKKYLPKSVKLQVAADGRPITLYDLATHTSGLPRMPDNFAPADSTNPYADYSVEQLYAFLSGHEPRRAAGVEAEYSNLGMGLLGHILARRMDTSYEELVRARITGPLGMKDTVITLTPELKERLARGHDANLKPVANWDIPTLAGAGALRSTVDDMLTFAAANLGLVETKLAPVLAEARRPRENFGTDETEVGFGWITTRRHDHAIVLHNGGTGGYHSFIGLDLENGRGVVVLSNATPSIDDIGLHLLEPEYELVDVSPPETTAEIPGSPAGEALKRWLEVTLGDDTEAVRAHYDVAFDDSFKTAVPLETYLGVRDQLRGLLKDAGIAKVVARSDRDLTAYSKSQGVWLGIHIQVAAEDPHRIVGLLVQPTEPPE